MDLTRLMSPRAIAVVGATPRADTYAHETLRNLALLGYDGAVWGVHPTHRSVLGREVFPSVGDLPEPADAVVVAVPAAGVPDVLDEAGAVGCGGAVVFGAGFADAGEAALEDRVPPPGRGPRRPGRAPRAAGDRAELRRDGPPPRARGPVGRRAAGAGAGRRRARQPERQP